MPDNQKYLKHWDDYQEDRLGKGPILCPVVLDINEKGEFVRERMIAPDVKKLYIKCRDEIPQYVFNKKFSGFDPDKIFKDYVTYFAKIDGVQGPGVPSPLDLKAKVPVWILYYLKKRNWKFSKERQYSTENDRDDLLRNFSKICTLDNRNAFLLLNDQRSGPKGLKFNLHVDISQMVDGKKMVTPIIIDPDQSNDPPYNNGGY